MVKKTTFALFFGNRGFFPPQLIAEARKEIPEVLKKSGYDYVMLDEKTTRFGAVETPAEGEIYAKFLEKNRGKFGGIILSLPNFGDETGAVIALKKAGVPILIQAYPDELNKMGPAERRDSFCGKISIEDVFCQYGIPFTNLPPHTVSPSSDTFKKHLDYFDRVCRVVNGLDGLIVGAIGARTTAFKTVRIDELALQKNGITMETFDLSEIINKVKEVKEKKTNLTFFDNHAINKSMARGIQEK
jgi:L-fucose isomerase-like protein